MQTAGKPPELTVGKLVSLNSRECYQESLTTTMLKAEISLNETHIGSPVINKKGEVVAIYTAYQTQNTGGKAHVERENETHLLPVQLAINIYQSLKHKKSMKSPWTGFSVMRLNEKQEKQFPTTNGDRGGIAIEHVWKQSPADHLGVKAGDILVRFGHYRIHSPAEFQKWLYMYGVGHTVKMTFLRDNAYIVKEYTIEERPKWAVPN